MSTTIPTVENTHVLCTCSHTHPGSDEVCNCVHRHAPQAPTTVIVNGDEDSKKETTGEGFLRGVEIFFTLIAKAIQGLVFLVVLLAGGLVSSVRWAGVKIAEARAERKLKKDLAEEAVADAAEEPGAGVTVGDTEKSPRQEATRTAPSSEPSAQKPSPSKPAASKPKAKKTKARKEATLCSLCDKPAVNVWVTSSDLILAECEDHGGSPELKIQMGWVKK
jgi:hypothetical protein